MRAAAAAIFRASQRRRLRRFAVAATPTPVFADASRCHAAADASRAACYPPCRELLRRRRR
jgi:hypothetical protein